MGANIVSKSLEPEVTFNNSIIADEIESEDKLTSNEHQITRMFKDIEDFHPFDYLNIIESNISKKLISKQNFSEIKKLANHFKSNITSFFGFETKLTSFENKIDYLLAISSKKGERESLVNLIEGNDLPSSFMKTSEWKQVYNFVKDWADPNSVLYNNVLGLWFEFDTSISLEGVPIPNIFIQTKKLRADTIEEIKNINWITETAIPILTGKQLSNNVKNRFKESIKNLPEKTSLIHVGTMISRGNNGIRVVINRIKPKQIIPYLKTIGWTDDSGKLAKLIKDLERFVSRFILHITIGENVSPKVGLECSFSKDKFHLETEWTNFFTYLTNNKLCIHDKKHALLNFIGIDNEEDNNVFDISSYIPSVLINNSQYTNALVRFISHIKIVYQPDKPIEVKAYPGIRLFGKPTTEI
jgi:hypothetical protein